jgi:predicted HicB family RNase H-like nuclease
MAKPKKSLFAGIEPKKPVEQSVADRFVKSGNVEKDEIPAQTGKKKKLTLELEPELHKKFSIYCIQNDIKMTEFLREKIREVV